jgi:integrase
MAVTKQKTSKGLTKFYHYRFMSKGKLFQGVCEGCTTEKAALKYEKDIKQKANELAKQKSVKALVDNFRQEITGGSDILLADAFKLSLKKPTKRQVTEKYVKSKKAGWNDFYQFMFHTYPEIKKLADVRRKHAEEYIHLLRTSGKFNKEVTFKIGKRETQYTRNIDKLSSRNINLIHGFCSDVFNKLFEDAGLIENPFKNIPKLKKETESRDAFTEKELKLIAVKADAFIKAIFTIGIATALREGDICTLRWSEIDLDKNMIHRKMLKTKRMIEIPILPAFREFLLQQLIVSGGDGYVLPEHAEIYLKNPTGITWRVKKFLESIGIETSKKVDGRTQAVSIKDVHSLRHTFCYYAGVYGIPFLVVKDIVGHVSPQMTELYQKHADNRMKREKLMQMPDLMGLESDEPHALPQDKHSTNRTKLMQIIQNLPDDKINQAMEAMGELL